MGPAVLRAQQADGVRVLLSKVEAALGAGNRADFLAASTLDPADGDVSAFLDRWFTSTTTRAVIAERDRQTTPDGGLRLVLEALTEADNTGRLGTWILEIAPMPDGWRVRKVTASNPVEGLYRLELNSTKQFHAKDFVVKAEDLELRLPAGEVFVAEAGGGYAAAVLIGRGEMVFHPAPEAERRQVALYCGRDELRTTFQTAFVRLSPGDAAQTLPSDHLVAATVEPSVFARAREVFAEGVSKSFAVDLADLSRDSWSLLPTTGDFLAEIATSKFGTLTYAHASNDEEDISLFDRLHKRNISVYTSAARLATRGPSYNEDDGAEYDVQDYQVDNTFQPDRSWMEGRTKLTVKVRAYALSALTIRLAESLAVQSVSSENFGRLLALRVRGQNSLVVNLPAPVSRGDVLVMTVRYAGRLEPQGVERENIRVQSGRPARQPCHRRPRARTALRLQQPRRVVRAESGERLRHRDDSPHRAHELLGRVQRRACRGVACVAQGRRGRDAGAQALRLRGHGANPVSRLRHLTFREHRNAGRAPASRAPEAAEAIGFGHEGGVAAARDEHGARARPRARDDGARRRHRELLCVGRRRSSLPEPDHRRRREPDSRRSRARVPGDSQSAVADDAVRVAGRSPPRSTTTLIFSSRTNWRTSGGARRSGGRTITSSG